jgi:hypothetical protein
MTNGTEAERRSSAAVLRWVRARMLACTFVIILALGTLGLAMVALQASAPPKCLPGEYRSAGRSSSVQVPNSDSPTTRTLEVSDVEATQIVLGRAVAPARTRITVKTDAMPPNAPMNEPVGVRVQSFKKGKGGDVSHAVLSWGAFTSRQTAEIFLCIERESAGDDERYSFYLEPGIFTGAVTILDDRLPVTTIPFTLALAYSDPFAPLIPIGPVIFAGSLYLMVLRRAEEDDKQLVGLRDLDAYLRRPAGLAAIIVGSAAAVGVYSTTYLTNDTWGSSGADFLLLVTAMFTAFVSAGTAFRFVSNLEASRGPTGVRH